MPVIVESPRDEHPDAAPGRTPAEQPSAWQRARRVDTEDPVVSWAASLGVTALALFLRLWDLGTPKKFEFDETYYAKDAWSLANHGYVRQYVDGANEKILDGTTTGIWKDDPSLIVHPEVGKWLIALGEKAFGMDPFGWRIAAVVAGTLMVLVMCRLARRLTGSTLLGCTAGLLLSLDGLHFVLSRLALLDIFLALFMLVAVTCMVVDRDWYRAKLARLQPDPVTDAASWGPVRGLLVRPWLLHERGVLGPRGRDEVDGAVPDGRLRAHGLAVERRRPALVRRARRRSGARRSPTAYRRSSPSWSSAASSTRPRGRAGCCTPRSTRTPTPRRSTPATAARAPATARSSWTRTPTTTAGRRPGSRTRAASARSSSRCAPSRTTTRTCSRSTRTS